MTKDEIKMSNEGAISSRPRLDPANIEVVDDDMAAVLRAKTPAERVAMVDDMHDTARMVVGAGIRILHPEWTSEQVQCESIRRLLGEASRVSSTRS